MGVIIIINSPLPKYVFSLPQITPQPTQQQVRTLGWLFPALLTVVYRCPLPAQQPRPTYSTPPSHPAPSARQWPYPLTQKTLLLILTTPGSTAGPCFSPFFGWMGKYLYACMKWVRQLPSTDTWEGLLQVPLHLPLLHLLLPLHLPLPHLMPLYNIPYVFYFCIFCTLNIYIYINQVFITLKYLWYLKSMDWMNMEYLFVFYTKVQKSMDSIDNPWTQFTLLCSLWILYKVHGLHKDCLGDWEVHQNI